MSILKNSLGRVVSPHKTDFIERAVAEPKPDEVVIKIMSSAICGSDLHIFNGKHPSVPLPVTIGHEFSGTIEKTGRNVANLKKGERVTVEPCIVCGQCPACRHGEYGYCENISFTYRNGDGAMAQYITVKAANTYKLPDYLSFDEGALVEPLAVACHAVRRAAVTLGETVLIIGAGAIGLLTAALCKKSGAEKIIVADFSDSRLALAAELGATHTVNSGNIDLGETIKNLTDGRGVDKSFECVGVESAFLQAMLNIKKNGLATIVGIYEKPEITIPASRFVTHEIRIQGAQGYCWDFPVAIGAARDIPLHKLVTHHFALTDLQKALETCFDKTAGSVKVLIHPEHKN